LPQSLIGFGQSGGRGDDMYSSESSVATRHFVSSIRAMFSLKSLPEPYYSDNDEKKLRGL
jgi:hypothetical protein